MSVVWRAGKKGGRNDRRWLSSWNATVLEEGTLLTFYTPIKVQLRVSISALKNASHFTHSMGIPNEDLMARWLTCLGFTRPGQLVTIPD